MYDDYNFYVSSLTLIIFHCFDYSHRSRCEMASYYGFGLHFPKD